MFSKTFGYAIRATTYVALHSQDGQKIALQELSQKLEIPHHFLGKIMQDIVRNGILDSTKGPSGGFFTNAYTMRTPLLNILKITDGSLVFDHCALGARRCNSEKPCPLHDDFSVCRDGMLKAISAKTIDSMVSEARNGKIFWSE